MVLLISFDFGQYNNEIWGLILLGVIALIGFIERMAKPAKNQNFHPGRPNMWGMIRDITVAAINKGQFLLAIIAAIMLTIILRIPEERVYDLMIAIVDRLTKWYVWGWVLFIGAVAGWLITSRYLRKIHTAEVTRMAEEKTDLQEKLTGKVGSSNSKPQKKQQQ